MTTWSAPDTPSPSAILQDAERNSTIGQCDVALQQFVWFYENSLKYDEGQRGVRLSFALSAWHELGKRHAPAMEQFESHRDLAEARLRDGEGFNAFLDFTAFNELLGDDERTEAAFLWLREHRLEHAKQAFPVALPALVRLTNHSVCAEFLNPLEDGQRMLEAYSVTSGLASTEYEGEERAELQDFAEKMLINRAAILVGILAATGREKDARETVEFLGRAVSLPALSIALQVAAEGEIPAPYP